MLLIDAGYPGDRAEVLASLNKLGYTPGDVRAIVLTHAHIDHLGSAIWFAREHSTPVSSVTSTQLTAWPRAR